MKSTSSKCCSDCECLWSYSPDQSSPYGELSCTKGHWDGVEDPSTLSDPVECGDYRERE